MFANIYDALTLIVLFGFTILIHELGHFLVARRCGMVVDTFSIGFGPAIWKRKKNGVTYKIGIIPFGGYVALPQLDPSGMATIQGSNEGDAEKKTSTDGEEATGKDGEEQSIPPAKPWVKILVSFSGAAGNLLFAVALAWIIYAIPHTEEKKVGTKLGYVATNCPAYEQGLRPGDEIVAVNREQVTTWNEFMTECHLAGRTNLVNLTVRSDGGEPRIITVPVEIKSGSSIKIVEGIERSLLCVITNVASGGIAERAGLKSRDIVRQFNGVAVAGMEHFIQLVADRAGQATDIVVERDGKMLTLNLTPQMDSELGRARIGVGIVPGIEAPAMPWMEQRTPWEQIKGDTKGILRILRALVSRQQAGQAAGALGGPVMIITTLWISIKMSVINAVGFIRFLNVNLAILNLLPLPVLDGGHIMFSLWEWVTRRRIHPKFLNIVINVFATLLIAVFLFLTFRDTKWLVNSFKKVRAYEAAATNIPPEAAAEELVDDTLASTNGMEAAK